MIHENDPYYASGMYGQQETKGRTVLEVATFTNIAALLSSGQSWEARELVTHSILIAKESIKQLSRENGMEETPKFGADVHELELLRERIKTFRKMLKQGGVIGNQTLKDFDTTFHIKD